MAIVVVCMLMSITISPLVGFSLLFGLVDFFEGLYHHVSSHSLPNDKT